MERLPAALVFDRDGAVRDLIRTSLEERGIMTFGAESSAEAIELLSAHEIALLFIDIESPAPALAGLMARVAALASQPLVIGLVSAEAEAERSKSLDAGIFDLLPKPLREGLLSYRTERALRQLELLAATDRLREDLQNRAGLKGLVGRSAAMSRLRERLERISASDSAVWFSGEPGSGKELAARTLHACSSRAIQQFRTIDCQGSGRSDLERLCSAPEDEQPGIIYLAEPSGLPLDLQDALQTMIRKLPRNGADDLALPAPGPRILSGSLHDPQQAVGQGLLLPTLQEMLAADEVRLPALREREEDIALLAQHFVSTIRRINQLPAIRISEEALALLEGYGWPGNVRELRNTIEKAVILAVEGTIRKHDLPRAVREQSAPHDGGAGSPADRKFKDAKQEIVLRFESAYLTDLMQRFGGNVTTASRHAGMLRSALQRLLRKYGLKSSEFRKQRARIPSRKGAEKVLD
jgi:two-component system nitrogen regulation response regulator NtrX